MEIARVTAAINAEQGFKTLKEAIDLINTSATISLDAKTQSRYNREVLPADSLSIFCADPRVFELLARADYFQALKLTQAFSDKALSLAAELAVLRVGLSK
jgi:hypothetical protein